MFDVYKGDFPLSLFSLFFVCLFVSSLCPDVITTFFGNVNRMYHVLATYEIRHLRTLRSFQCLRSPLHDSICKVVSFSISVPLMPALYLATSLLVYCQALIFFPHIFSPVFATASHHPSLTAHPSELFTFAFLRISRYLEIYFNTNFQKET